MVLDNQNEENEQWNKKWWNIKKKLWNFILLLENGGS